MRAISTPQWVKCSKGKAFADRGRQLNAQLSKLIRCSFRYSGFLAKQAYLLFQFGRRKRLREPALVAQGIWQRPIPVTARQNKRFATR